MLNVVLSRRLIQQTNNIQSDASMWNWSMVLWLHPSNFKLYAKLKIVQLSLCHIIHHIILHGVLSLKLQQQCLLVISWVICSWTKQIKCCIL